MINIKGGYFLNYFIIGTCETNVLRFAKVVTPMSYLYAVIITIVFTAIDYFKEYKKQNLEKE